MSETCQRGCTGIAVDERGRVAEHVECDRVTLRCWRSGQVSLEEIARRRAAKDAARAERLAALEPDAAATLDALIEDRGNEDAALLIKQVDALWLAALTLYKQRHPETQGHLEHRSAAIVIRAPMLVFRCRFCDGVLGTANAMRVRTAAEVYRGHLAQCALEYLAGLRHVQEQADA